MRLGHCWMTVHMTVRDRGDVGLSTMGQFFAAQLRRNYPQHRGVFREGEEAILGGILRDNFSEGNCESVIVQQTWIYPTGPTPWSGPFRDHGLRPWSQSPSERCKPYAARILCLWRALFCIWSRRPRAQGVGLDLGDRFLSSTCTGANCALPMRVPNSSPVLDRNSAPMGPEFLSSTGAGAWRKAPKAFPDSRSVLDKFPSAVRPLFAELLRDRGGSIIAARHSNASQGPLGTRDTTLRSGWINFVSLQQVRV